MKKTITLILITIICLACFSSCADPLAAETEKPTADITTEAEDVDEHNRKILSKAMGLKAGRSRIDTYVSFCNTINAGSIQSAEFEKGDPDNCLNVVGEDGTNFKFYLSSGGSCYAIQNLDTGEWPVKSYQ